jgi:hypothetical protein
MPARLCLHDPMRIRVGLGGVSGSGRFTTGLDATAEPGASNDTELEKLKKRHRYTFIEHNILAKFVD